ncbi:hypothetical protein CVT25_006228 [Psilocybe cyanescens]|uniref:Uncharacterized protein n=1 Tax=Psilocybe cyanescens TaxID=93625 RepID=A0A409XKI2_PSICY|nr:hypothetical protein CVT25_006228 [Psilocybe cyanescens]
MSAPNFGMVSCSAFIEAVAHRRHRPPSLECSEGKAPDALHHITLLSLQCPAVDSRHRYCAGPLAVHKWICVCVRRVTNSVTAALSQQGLRQSGSGVVMRNQMHSPRLLVEDPTGKLTLHNPHIIPCITPDAEGLGLPSPSCSIGEPLTFLIISTVETTLS